MRFLVARLVICMLNLSLVRAFIPAAILFWVSPSRYQNPANEKSFDIIIIDDIFAVRFSANIASGDVL